MSLRGAQQRGNPDAFIKQRPFLPAGLPRCARNDELPFYAKRRTAASASPPDGTTGETTSHLTKLQTAQQVIGYSHLTDETTSHPTKQPQNSCQVVGYKAASCQVIGYRNDELPFYAKRWIAALRSQ